MPKSPNDVFAGETALVTGASRGIGQAIALDLAEYGAYVFGTATSYAGAGNISKMFTEAGLKGSGFVLDLGDHVAIRERIRGATGQHSPISILVNNAGITRDGPVIGMREDWNRVIDVNLTGTLRVIQAVLRSRPRERDLSVVTIGSVIGATGNAGQANYAASKAGLEAATRSLAQEYEGRGVLFNMVRPGFVDTDMTKKLKSKQMQQIIRDTKLKRAYTPQEIAECVRETLLSRQTGQIVAIDGGLTQ